MKTHLVCIFLALLLCLAPTRAQDVTPFVAIPLMSVSGNLILAMGNLYDVNTDTENVKMLVETQKTLHSLSLKDNTLFYAIANEAFAYDLETNSATPIFTFNTDEPVAQYRILSPLVDHEMDYLKILDRFNPNATDTYTIARYDAKIDQYTELFSIESGQITDLLPLPPGRTRLRYGRVHALRNPVYKNWFMIDFRDASDPDDLSSFDGTVTQETVVSLLFLWNQETNTFISLDGVVGTNGSEDQLMSMGWNPEGDKITVTSSNGILTILNVNSESSEVRIAAQASVGNKLARHWLGVNDLLIVTSSETSTSSSQFDTVFSIGAIIDNVWYEREFLYVPQRNLNQSSIESIWHLTADEAERHQLSCLFDLALPTRLTETSSVMTASSLAVMSDPQPDAAILTTLNPHTVITLAGEKACTDYVRWQKVILSDGQSGWVMEADQNHHYLEVK